jgi:hypothetical protein
MIVFHKRRKASEYMDFEAWTNPKVEASAEV